MRHTATALGQQVVIAPLPAAQRPLGALLAARAMQDNPMHVAALGPDLRRRVEVMHRAFGVLLESPARHVLGAWHEDRLVGIAAYTSADHCQPGRRQWLRFPPTLARAGTRAPRLLRWLAAWSRRDPDIPHCHLGPVPSTRFCAARASAAGSWPTTSGNSTSGRRPATSKPTSPTTSGSTDDSVSRS